MLNRIRKLATYKIMVFALMYAGTAFTVDKVSYEKPNILVVVADYYKNSERAKKLPADFYSPTFYTNLPMDCSKENESNGQPFMTYLAHAALSSR